MRQERFDEIQERIAAEREAMFNDSLTAHAIDRNDPWEEIADCARRDGMEELAEFCEQAAREWLVDNS